jgi:hypothetical protein
VPIPYPNFGMASDLASGSSTVKIGGKPVSQENASYYKKISGDEAGAAPKKGVITSKNMGKAYSQMWSMDVKFEGKGFIPTRTTSRLIRSVTKIRTLNTSCRTLHPLLGLTIGPRANTRFPQTNTRRSVRAWYSKSMIGCCRFLVPDLKTLRCWRSGAQFGAILEGHGHPTTSRLDR